MAKKKIRDTVPVPPSELEAFEQFLDTLTTNPLGDIEDPTGSYVPVDHIEMARRIASGQEDF